MSKNDSIYVEISMLADRILQLMDQYKSTYEPAKEHVREAKKNLVVDPKKAVREMRKAYDLIEEENNLVGEFERCYATFSINRKLSSSDSVGQIEARFRKLIREGSYRKAQSELSDLKKLMDNGSLTGHLSVAAVDNVIHDGKVRVTLTNICGNDILIDSIHIESRDVSITSSPPMIRSLRRNSSTDFDVTFGGNIKEVNLVLFKVRYEANLENFYEELNIRVFSEEHAGTGGQE